MFAKKSCDQRLRKFARLSMMKYFLSAIKKLKNTNAAGPDDIPAIGVKRLGGFLSLYLTHIINLCFAQGKFPMAWKLAKIIPLYKLHGDKDKAKKYNGSNYRPVANLNARRVKGLTHF